MIPGDRVQALRTMTQGRDGAQIAAGEVGTVREVDGENVWVEWDIDGFRYKHSPVHLRRIYR